VGHFFNAQKSGGHVMFHDGQTGGKAGLFGYKRFEVLFTN
jgi:hypothetical protein